MNPSLTVAAAVLLLCSAQAPSASQSQAFLQGETAVKLRADTRVVEIDVSVRDSQGRPVEDLKASDFTVTDNGKARPFTIFSFNRGAPDRPPSDSPGLQNPPVLAATPALPPGVFTNTGAPAPPPTGHSTILLLDGANGWFDTFAHGVQGVEGLMAKVPPDEKIAVYVVAKDLGLLVLQDYTTDRQLLKEKVASFTPRGMKPAPAYMDPTGDGSGMVDVAGAGRPSPRRGPPNPKAAPPDLDPLTFRQGVSKGFDMRIATEDLRRSLNALAAKLRKLPGRKSVFWITEGFPPVQLRNMDAAWDSTIAALNDANIQINTVDADGLGGPNRLWGPGAILAQQQIADRTGGTAYFHRNDLDAAMASGIADARSSYTLGFYLTEMDGKYHALKVNVDRPGLQLNYRQGYATQDESVPDASARKSTLQSALLNPLGYAEVGITASFDVVPGKPRDTLHAHLTLAPGPLSLQPTPAGYTGKVEEMFLELDAEGRQVGRFSDTKLFTVDASYKPQFDIKGVTLSQAIPLVTGAVKLSIVVRDTASGRMGSLAVPLGQVPGQRAPK